MSAAAQLDTHGSEDHSSPFYFNASHWRAIDGVKEGVRERSGIMVLSGPTGSGKTMLMRAISEGLEEGATPLFLQYASLNFREFVNFLHNSLKVEDEIHDASNKAVALRKYLYAQAERNETSVVFIDEAQNLEPDVLKMLPKLASFDRLEDGRVVGMQFVLVGGSELREFLDDSDFDEVRGSIARSYELRFFTREELRYFLDKRLAPLARMTPEPITEEAIETVGKYTGGSPRLIGMICSHAMLFAAENPGRSIDAAMIEEAAEAQMIDPVENPFAHEDDDAGQTGPFSSAELKGEELTADADEPVTPLADDEDEDDATVITAEDDLDDDAAIDAIVNLDHGPIPSVDDLAEEHDDVVTNLDDRFANMDGGPSARFLEDNDEPLEGEKKTSVIGRLASSIKSRKIAGRSAATRVVGAGRKANNPERQAEPNEKRKMKTRIAGEREKKIKYASVACGFAALVAVAWMIRTPIVETLTGATRAVSSTASRAAESVSATATATATAVREAATSAPTPAPENTEVAVATPSMTGPALVGGSAEMPVAAPSGWGAKVEVQKTLSEARIPEPAVNIARSALDIVDRAIEKGAESAPESVRAALKVAAQDVEMVRQKVTARGGDIADIDERVAALVADGDKHFSKQIYVAPRNANAYDSYRQALDLKPGYEPAMLGIEKLRSFYASKADAARAAQKWERANNYFETALSISKLRPIR